MDASACVKELYEAVGDQLGVEPEFLKIIYKGKSLVSSEELCLTDIKVTNGAKMMALGRKVLLF